MRTLLTLTLASLALAAALAPARADACSPAFCRAWKSLEVVHTTPVPGEGVLVIAATFGEGFDDPIDTDLGAVLVEVSSEMGEIITGELELVDDPLVLVWRPDAPLQPGNYDVQVSADNSVFGDEGWCADANVNAGATVEITADPLADLAAPPIVGEAEVVVEELFGLESLVCCDDAYPVEVDCGYPGVQWSSGFCAPTSGSRRLKATFTVDAGALAASAGQIVVTGFDLASGTLTQTSSDVVCVTPTALHLASGKTIEGDEVCVGARLVDQLGPVDLDPTDVLAEQCAGEPYTCEAEAGTWDERACEPWPAGEETTTSGGETTGGTTGTTGTTTSGTTAGPTTDPSDGTTEDTSDTSASSGGEQVPESSCACRSDAGGPAGLLWLIALAPLLRSRRRRR